MPSAAVLKVAWPLLSEAGMALPPSTAKLTVPVGVPEDAETTAVKVTSWPKTLGFAEEVSVIVVPGALTDSVNEAPLAALKLLSPLYEARMASCPTGKVEVVKLAWPPLSVRTSGVPAAVTVTLPVGVPEFGGIGETVMTNVTGCPNVMLAVVVVMAVISLALATENGSEVELGLKLLSPL
jgi:hypothetical protein